MKEPSTGMLENKGICLFLYLGLFFFSKLVSGHSTSIAGYQPIHDPGPARPACWLALESDGLPPSFPEASFWTPKSGSPACQTTQLPNHPTTQPLKKVRTEGIAGLIHSAICTDASNRIQSGYIRTNPDPER
jgi:hypothetical protein